MKIKEFIILNFIGRSGTTILRNELGKYKNICTLPTNLQVDLLKKIPKDKNFCPYFLKDYIEKDIANVYGKDKYYKKSQDINSFIYKMPLQTFLIYADINIAKRLTPILIVRNPIENVISASQKEFVKISEDYKLLLKKLEISYSKLYLNFPKNLIENIEHMDVFEQRTILYKLAFKLTKYYLENIKNNYYLAIKFEDLINKPIDTLSKILLFMEINVSYSEIIKKLNKTFYIEAIEEGGIKMSLNLSKDRVKKYKNIDEKIIKKIKNLLEKEIKFYENMR